MASLERRARRQRHALTHSRFGTRSTLWGPNLQYPLRHYQWQMVRMLNTNIQIGYPLVHTSTGRLNRSMPNEHRIPRHTPEGDRIKQAFVSYDYDDLKQADSRATREGNTLFGFESHFIKKSKYSV